MKIHSISSLLLSLILVSCSQKDAFLSIHPGKLLNKSGKVVPGVYLWNGTDSLNEPVLVITGNNIELDFSEVELKGSNDKQWPNQFYGLGILVKDGQDITIRNLNVKGFKVGLMAEHVENLKLIDCDLSYNFRQKLYSSRERESLTDWMSYHINEKDEWLRYGAAVYLKNCLRPRVQGLTVTQGQNGLLMVGCSDGLIYNNTIQFNSGLGIGLYRSNDNRIMHNKLDWNVRGHSPGKYARGQDSAGILCYEQSNNNVFAYNSATHSGDGFFLWAGQTTMDSGKGGCNNNLIYKNDFSFAPTNGVEVTFSKNIIADNVLEGCKYGIWGGYSFESEFLFNEIIDCQYGISIEHGQNNRIAHNYFGKCEAGIQLWERETQPDDWGYAKAKDVNSQNYTLRANAFEEVEVPFAIEQTSGLVVGPGHYFQSIEEAGKKKINQLINGQLDTTGSALKWHTEKEREVVDFLQRQKISPLPDGMNTQLPNELPTGRNFMLINEWGPYNFQYPSIWLRSVDRNAYNFVLLGPEGNWKLVGGAGIKQVGPKTGSFPATIKVERLDTAKILSLQLEFIGNSFVNQFGDTIPKGSITPVKYSGIIPPFSWQVKWYNYPEELEIATAYDALPDLTRSALAESEVEELAFRWWGAPALKVDPEHFITKATTQFIIPDGKYRIFLTSDDGVKLFLDGQLLIDEWSVHVPKTNEIDVTLGGKHQLELDHFEAGGLSTLDFRMKPID